MVRKGDFVQKNNGEEKMIKVNAQNEKVKHKYYDFLKESEGYSEATITAIKKSIYRYEEFADFEDFSKFNKNKAIEFKKWLEERKDERTKKQISVKTCYDYIRHLKDFFKWLSYQPGFKSKLCTTDIEYLKLSKEKSRMALSSKREHYPTFEQVKKVVESIEIKTELDLRDRALICFTLLSGMRDNAIITLPIGAFNEHTLSVNQNPNLGVKTKFSKQINSVLFKFDTDMLNYFLEWVKYLKTERLFGNADPIFSQNKLENGEESMSFTSNSVESKFWKSVNSMRTIFKQRFEQAGIEYFSPHTFRHLASSIAISKCRNGHEIKAVSQNFGHENVGTTMTTYGTINNSEVNNIISGLDFSNSYNMQSEENILIAKLKKFLKQEEQGNF